MLKITLATGNEHKVEEINLIARDYNIQFVLPVGEFNPIEDSDNFLGNAYCKARCASESQITELYLADDSGLCVEALNGEPGIHSARYAPTAKERINKLLGVMKNIDNRKAHFTCAMVIVDKNAKILFQTQQYCHGEILREEIGNGGFGYDPIFYVEEEKKGMAQLTSEKKAQVSHRAKALNEVLKWIKDEYVQSQNK
ncbi:MAG: RdgB/HAM1 family non-canonical purine NTP pyrophosphatase [Candidatus Gastranaerophilales bacterium]|nr:RdgB/HAM1 family non-canonical purine NTP pyrophosphatase [Candidatus Gastranaerophilales bacterium]